MPSIDVANRIEELTGTVYGIERLTYGDGGNFGGSPIAVSLLSNNIEELKAAKTELKEIQTYRHKKDRHKKDRHTERQTYIKTDIKRTDTQKERHTDRQTERQKDI